MRLVGALLILALLLVVEKYPEKTSAQWAGIFPRQIANQVANTIKTSLTRTASASTSVAKRPLAARPAYRPASKVRHTSRGAVRRARPAVRKTKVLKSKKAERLAEEPRGAPKLHKLVKRSSLGKKADAQPAVSPPSVSHDLGGREVEVAQAPAASGWRSKAAMVAQGLGATAAVGNQALATAVQVQSLKLMGDLQLPSSSSLSALATADDSSESDSTMEGEDVEPSQSTSSLIRYYSRSARFTEECPVAVPNVFTSVNRQICPSSDADVVGDPDRSFSSADENEDDGQDDEKIDRKRIIWGDLKVSPNLVLRYRDFKKLKAYGFSGSYVCRREVMAVTDKRVSFVQGLQVIPLTDASKIELFFKNKKSAFSCSKDRLPLSALASGQPRSQVPEREEGKIPEITVRKQRQLAWRGLVWATTKIKNSCNIDSFLTFILFKCKASPSYMTRNFLIPQDGYENLLRELCTRFKTFGSDDGKLMPVKKAHEEWKGLWFKAFYPRFQRDLVEGKAVDVRAGETESVGEHLERSLVYLMTYHCSCAVGKIKARKAFVPSVTLNELKVMSRCTQPSGSSQDEPLGLAFSALSDVCSDDCSGTPVLNFIFVPTTTWFLFFYLERPTYGYDEQTLRQRQQKQQPLRSPVQISQLPLVFVAHELHLNGRATFQLGYVSVITTKAAHSVGIRHQMSFMRFNNRFYLYDDAAAGAAIYASDPDALLVSQELTVVSATYFRD
jgi:hypothetical protein